MIRALQGHPIPDLHVKPQADKKLQQSKWQYDARFRRHQNILHLIHKSCFHIHVLGSGSKPSNSEINEVMGSFLKYADSST